MTLPTSITACGDGDDDPHNSSSTSTASCPHHHHHHHQQHVDHLEDLEELLRSSSTSSSPDQNNNNNNSHNERGGVATGTTGVVVVALEEDADMFGPPRSTPLLNANRPRVPMISAKLRLREERKRVLQVCAHKLEKIKDSETNLRRSVCINNTYARLTEEVRREKQSRYLANLPKCDIRNRGSSHSTDAAATTTTITGGAEGVARCCRLTIPNQPTTTCFNTHCCAQTKTKEESEEQQKQQQQDKDEPRVPPLHSDRPATPINPPPVRPQRRRSQVESDLESLDREIAAMNASMPPIDPEMTQGAEQLEKAVVSRKRTRMEAALENDHLLALSQFYFPTQRLLSSFDDSSSISSTTSLSSCMGEKRPRLSVFDSSPPSSHTSSTTSSLVDFDLSPLNEQHQREIEVIMETLRFGSTMVSGGGAMAGGASGMSGQGVASSPPPSPATDSCGHAAMLSEQCSGGGGFHSLVVASLET